MTRRPRLPRAPLLLVLAGLAACGGGAPKQRPDVILIVVDTLRNDRLSAYGYPRPTSPFLDSAMNATWRSVSARCAAAAELARRRRMRHQQLAPSPARSEAPKRPGHPLNTYHLDALRRSLDVVANLGIRALGEMDGDDAYAGDLDQAMAALAEAHIEYGRACAMVDSWCRYLDALAPSQGGDR